jgi:hypothetical protein
MENETLPEAFLNFARSYCEAANILLDVNSTKEQNQLFLEPIYMLYFHATELALKAFLRHKGFKSKKLRDKKKFGHNLFKLYKICVEEGFVSSNNFATELRDITNLLDSGNDDMAFRYWNPKSLTTANIDWVKKVVNKLIELVETYIPPNKNPGRTVKATLFLSEEQPIKY